jgi:hypothetical protein
MDSYDSKPLKALGYFYFSFSDAEKQNTTVMLGSLIKQLCCRRPNTPQSVQDLGQYKEKGQHPDMKTLEDTLVATIHGFSDVYVVIDALDECPYENGERKKLLASICRIYEKTTENLHLLCTSRREVDIETVMTPLLAISTNTTIDLLIYKHAVDRDIGFYIDKTFESSDFVDWTKAVKEDARAILIQKADGM